MKKKYISILISVLSIFLSYQKVNADSSIINKSSETESTGIDSGFVILDERYIEPPYIISCRDSKIFINDIEIPKPVRHPGEKYAFENKDIKNLSIPDQKKLSKILEMAPEVYKSFLEKGNVLIFSSEGGYETINLYTAIYRPSNLIKKIHTNQSVFARRMDNLFVSFLYIDEFNNQKSQPINKGYVFIDGRYIDAPYIVERKGLGIFINDILIQVPNKWPLPNYGDVSINITDPNQPLSINEYSCLYDPDVINYLSMKSAYLREHYPIEEAVVRIRDAYKNLPCIKQAKLDPNNIAILHVEWTDGSDVNTRLVPIQGREPIKMDKQKLLERTERSYKSLEEDIRRGSYYFFETQNSGSISGNMQEAQKILPKIVPILKSSMPVNIKIKEIKQAGMHIDDRFESFLTNFISSSQLDTRLNISIEN